jgi:MFS family permease
MTPLALPAFRAFVLIRFLMAAGWHMQVLVISWTMWSITGDPLMLGMVGLAEAVPAIGAALPFGYLVDKLEKRRAIRIAAAIMIFSAICTGILVQPFTLPMLGRGLTVSLMLCFVVVNGVARSIYTPAMFTALSMVSAPELLARATAVASAAWQSAMVTGPMIGGLLYGTFGVGTAVIVTLLMMCTATAATLWLPMMPAVASTSRGSLRADVTTGFRFILGNQVILGALSLDMFGVLFGGAVAMLPVFADTILHVDAAGLGVLRAAPAIGSVITMAVLSLHPPENNTGRKLLMAVCGFGVMTIAFALSSNFFLSVGLLFCVGSFDAVSVVIRHTILQIHTPDEMRGRVAAANTMFISSSNEIGALESGVAARLLGLVPSVVFGGAMTLVVVALVSLRAPALRRLQLQTPGSP